jgi:hypothetical protein
MKCTPEIPRRQRFRAFVLVLSATFALPAWAYDYPLSTQAIRDAYFQGKQEAGLGTDFLAKYTHSIPELKVRPYISRVRIETPFFQVAEHASRVLNYSAQDAVEDFYGKPAMLRMYLEIFYEIDAPLPNSVRINVTQNRKPITTLSDERTAFSPANGEFHEQLHVPNLGEEVTLEFDPAKLDSSTLTIRIDTADGEHTSTELDFQSLR